MHVALATTSHDARPLPDRSTAAVTTLPGRIAPTGDTVLPGFATAHPVPGGVTRVAGPFDDRFTVSSTRLRRGAVAGVLTVTSDVSEVIDLQVMVGFYDARGTLLGTGTWEKHGEGARPDEVVRYFVTAPAAYRDRAVAAAIGVPVLVNE